MWFFPHLESAFHIRNVPFTANTPKCALPLLVVHKKEFFCIDLDRSWSLRRTGAVSLFLFVLSISLSFLTFLGTLRCETCNGCMDPMWGGRRMVVSGCWGCSWSSPLAPWLCKSQEDSSRSCSSSPLAALIFLVCIIHHWSQEMHGQLFE